MIRTDEDALICDLAETYNIYDYKRLPLKTVAALSVGLRDNSRIKMRLSGATIPTDTMLLAAIVDRLSLLVWMNTKDAEKGRNRPKSILDSLTEKDSKVSSYASGEDFMKQREKLLERR